MQIKDFRIYIADISMLKQFVDLEAICFAGDIIKEPEYRKLFNRSNVKIYGLWYKSELIVSAIVICKENKKRCHLYSLCVHPLHRNIGLARAVLDGIEQDCAAQDYIMMYLELREDNSEAYTCYSHQGYFTFGHFDKFYEDGCKAIRMQKILTQKTIFKKNRLAMMMGM